MFKSFSQWPKFSNEEVEAVKSVLLSNKVNYWTGQIGRSFEKEFAKFVGCDYGIALANGTVALDLALHGLSIGSSNGGKKEDEVIVTPRSFIASVSAIVNAGATPVFVDIDRDSQNIDAKKIKKIVNNKTKAIICVHLAGWSCDIDEIKKTIEANYDYNIKIIEDCAQAHGAKYKGKSVGSLGDVAAWSFCQDKIMTTGGEGGMVTCNSEKLWRKMWAYKDHGKSYRSVYEKIHPPGFKWLHESFGTNFRITEMQSAIGLIQLKKLPNWSKTRAGNAKILYGALKHFSTEEGPLRLPIFRHNNCEQNCNNQCCWHANYKFYAFIKPQNLKKGWSRDRIIEEINKEGVPCYQGSCSEIYLEKAFKKFPAKTVQRLPVAKELGETSIMFCVHPTLGKVEMTKMSDIIAEVLNKSSY